MVDKVILFNARLVEAAASLVVADGDMVCPCANFLESFNWKALLLTLRLDGPRRKSWWYHGFGQRIRWLRCIIAQRGDPVIDDRLVHLCTILMVQLPLQSKKPGILLLKCLQPLLILQETLKLIVLVVREEVRGGLGLILVVLLLLEFFFSDKPIYLIVVEPADSQVFLERGQSFT